MSFVGKCYLVCLKSGFQIKFGRLWEHWFSNVVQSIYGFLIFYKLYSCILESQYCVIIDTNKLYLLPIPKVMQGANTAFLILQYKAVYVFLLVSLTGLRQRQLSKYWTSFYVAVFCKQHQQYSICTQYFDWDVESSLIVVISVLSSVRSAIHSASFY